MDSLLGAVFLLAIWSCLGLSDLISELFDRNK